MDQPKTFYIVTEREYENDPTKTFFEVQETVKEAAGWRMTRVKRAASLEKARALIPEGKTREDAKPQNNNDAIEYWK